MLSINNAINEYFSWLHDLVCGDRYSDKISYKKLLKCLHSIEFRFLITRDQNRADDGADLRWRFIHANQWPNRFDPTDIYDALEGPCSVLEMMVALAIRCEETIMDDPKVGDRTRQWFWDMIVNLGLGSMTDANFDEKYVIDTVNRFLDRDYAPDGKGGLFTVRNAPEDLRAIEIWWQLLWYLDSIT